MVCAVAVWAGAVVWDGPTVVVGATLLDLGAMVGVVVVGVPLVGVVVCADADADADVGAVEVAAAVSEAGDASEADVSLLDPGSDEVVPESSEDSDPPDVVASVSDGALGTLVGATVGTSSVDDGGTV